MFDIDGWMEDRKREEEIRCPYCDGSYDFLEDAFEYGLVTCWGGDSDVELCCSHCDKIFYVIENVRRTFEVSKGP